MILSQYRLSQFMARKKSDHNATAFAVPPTPAGAATSSVMTDLPNPFPRLPVVETEVKVEDQPCAMCFQPLGVKGPDRPVWCDVCHEYWHLKCANLSMPPRYNSWACPRCLG